MTRTIKTGLLAGASSLVLATMVATPAAAFDKVDWTWDLDIKEKITKNIDIDISIDPDGLVLVEDLQVFVGNATATSSVTNINNIQPVELGEETFEWDFDVEGSDAGSIANDGTASPGIVSALVGLQSVSGTDIDGTATVTIDLGAFVQPPNLDALDELPSVVSAATAGGNIATIDSEYMVELHEGQFVFDVKDVCDTTCGDPNIVPDILETNNTFLSVAGVLGWYAINGVIEASDIHADSNISQITNAYADGSATAIANSLTVNIQENGDEVLMGDMTQFAFADITADQTISNVTLNHYTGLGQNKFATPIASSVATAVGNIKSLSVGVPE